ncbi:MAG: hypothetical protein N3D71_01290 [Burkholderiaceae bacterium]|nr:hypothetical protein [Burkholderiaceae bacterium]
MRAFDDEHVAPAPRQLARHRQADHAGADDDAVDAFHAKALRDRRGRFAAH